MNFYIQASNPAHIKRPEIYHETLLSALEGVFPYKTEDVILVWNRTRVAWNYSEVFSCMVEDVFEICDALRSSGAGTYENGWGSNVFDCVWQFCWSDGIVEITSVPMGVGGFSELTRSGPVKIEIEQFIAEWKMPMVVCQRALLEGGYRDDHLADLRRMDSFIKGVTRNGYLYNRVDE